MRTRPLFAALVAASTIAFVPRPAVAQQSALAARTVANPNRAGVVPARIVATYDVRSNTVTPAFARTIVIADSAGVILASINMSGESRTIPMTVTVIETNLVLQGETSDGLLTLVLENQNEGGTTKLVNGSWTLGKTTGTLRGRTQP
jgi:hypothetical protein